MSFSLNDDPAFDLPIGKFNQTVETVRRALLISNIHNETYVRSQLIYDDFIGSCNEAYYALRDHEETEEIILLRELLEDIYETVGPLENLFIALLYGTANMRIHSRWFDPKQRNSLAFARDMFTSYIETHSQKLLKRSYNSSLEGLKHTVALLHAYEKEGMRYHYLQEIRESLQEQEARLDDIFYVALSYGMLVDKETLL